MSESKKKPVKKKKPVDIVEDQEEDTPLGDVPSKDQALKALKLIFATLQKEFKPAAIRVIKLLITMLEKLLKSLER